MATSTEILSFDQWRPDYEAEKNANSRKGAKRSKASKFVPIYTPEKEVPPDKQWYGMNKEKIDFKIYGIASKVLATIHDSRPEDMELAQLRRAAFSVQEVAAKEPKSVALVGQQAMGKSLLINAILHRRVLSKTSAAGGACTASAIKYLHKPGTNDLDETYDAEIQFMDNLHLNEVSEEHARRYAQFHFAEQDTNAFRDDEERLAATADWFFKIVFDAYNDEEVMQKVEALLTPENIGNGNLLRRAVRAAHRRIADAGANERGVIAFPGQAITKLMGQIQHFISHHETLPALWPIVQHVQILMGSGLLKHGISIIDLPGLGDMNHSRVAATNAIRRNADFEIIIARSDRVTTEVVDQQLRQSIRAHGAKNTALVLTRIDEFFADKHSIDDLIENWEVQSFPLIKSWLKLTEERQEVLLAKQDEEEDDDADVDELDAIQHYITHLHQAATIAFIRWCAKTVEDEMRFKYKDLDESPINVLSVSASVYLEWLKPRQKEHPRLTPELTGIPKLRQFLLSLSADDNLKHYRHHVSVKLPMFLDKIARIVDDDKKNDAYVEIRPDLKGHVSRTEKHHQLAIRDFLESNVPRLWKQSGRKSTRLAEISKIVEEWGRGVGWNTYDKMLRERGIPFSKSQSKKYKGTTINWNDEICQVITHDIDNWRNTIRAQIKPFATKMHEATGRLCDDILKSIKASPLITPLKDIAIEEWENRRTHVLEHSASLEGTMKDEMKAIYRYATTETDIRCMISKLNTRIYDQIQQLKCKDWYKTQRASMTSALIEPDKNHKTILDRSADAVDTSARETFTSTFAVYTKELIRELNLFDEHISERLPPEYDITQLDQALRTQLKALLPQLEKEVQGLQSHFDLVGKQETQDSRVADMYNEPEPKPKRQKTENDEVGTTDSSDADTLESRQELE